MKFHRELPQDYTYRFVKRFAWLPKRIGFCIVWLEYYNVTECYRRNYDKASLFTWGKWSEFQRDIIK